MRLLVLLFAIPLLCSAKHVPFAEPFEIRVSPANSVYRLTLNNEQRLYNCVIHNVAVINRTPEPILLQRIEFQLINKGEVVQTRLMPGSELESRAQRIFALHNSGALDEAEKEFRLRELFRDAELSPSNRLEPNQGILIRHQYLQFSGDADKIRVVAAGGSNNTSLSQSSAEITVLDYQPKTKFSFPLKQFSNIALLKECRSQRPFERYRHCTPSGVPVMRVVRMV